MVKLPDHFVKNICDTFREEGRSWLSRLEEIVEACIELWDLADCVPVENLSFNYVCTARSSRFGHVILKVGVNPVELDSERRALELLGRGRSCRCLAWSKSRNALLLERFEPGENLFSLDDEEEQIQIGASLLPSASAEPNGEAEGFPRYANWMDRTFSIVREIEVYTSKARSYFREIEESFLPEKILHGDYHHQNILRKGKEWYLIDPKGVLGKQTSDCGRFILNHLAKLPEDRHLPSLKRMAEEFSRTLKVPEDLILKGAYVDFILSNSWTLEGEISGDERENIYRKLQYYDNLYCSLLN